MWVEGGDIQDELLDQLGAVLTAPEDLALTPSAAEFDALAAVVAARWPDGAASPAEAVSEGVHQLRRAGARPLRRLGSSAWRAGTAAAGIVVFSASAAAANGGVPLPRPVRVVAYTVGLPVDSPALDDTNRHVEELKKAVKANDAPKAQATARRLQTDLTKVPGHEKKEAEQKVGAAMKTAEPLIVAPSATTTTTAPAPSTTATTAASPTTATTKEVEEKEKDKARGTTTTAPTTSTTTDPESTTTTTAPETDETPSDGGTPSGEPGTGSGDPGAGGAGTGGGDQGSTTPTTTPDGGTTTTTTPDGGGASGGGDPGSTTTTTSSTTTTTMPPSDPAAGTP